MSQLHTLALQRPRVRTAGALMAAVLGLTLALPAMAATPDSRHHRDGRHDRGRHQGWQHDDWRQRGHHRERQRDDAWRGHREYRSPRYDDRSGRFYGYGHRSGFRVDRRYEAPRHIARRYDYDRYYYGRVYYGPHHHYHAVYNFPVYVDGGYYYEPYAYCEGNYFDGGSFYYDGPRLSIHWRF